MAEDTIYYYMFSTQQMKEKKEALKKIDKDYVPGEVRVGTRYEQFTEKLTDPKEASYPDARIVISGKSNEIVVKKK